MKVLILGGHGFVGKKVLSFLEKTGHEVVPASRRDGLDLTDYGSAKNWFERVEPEAIVNCAAHVGSVHYVTTYTADVLTENLRMTINIYRAVKEVCPDARIINPLSNCSYPGDSDVQYEQDWWKGEVHQSVFAYGNYKRFIYVIAECYRRQYGIKSIDFLVPNTFGPGDSTDPNKTHALNGMIIRMLKAHSEKQSEFEIWGTGKPVREWAYIDDVVEVLTQGLTLDVDLTYPANISQNKGYSIKESAEMIARAVGFKGNLAFNTSYQDGDPKKVLDDRNFRRMFPNFLFTDHEEGIRRTVGYYKSVLKKEK